ncbi:IS66 family insertion sequence element accessory protein TnpB [Acidocella sp. MX-AZ02]|uniref:IS66 family insertion sequence element accessory protein TnpB n=1 Tax=Acidocella sp. MX-AZ02 TaxID=1214225 RepID=UPI000A059B1D|nr:IS66 family insertion sequence element accessory protein TnpB [Acidocella sp. MX-AZ02]
MLSLDPHNGTLYVFRGKRGDLVKILWWDGLGGLFCKRQRSCYKPIDLLLSDRWHAPVHSMMTPCSTAPVTYSGVKATPPPPCGI